MKRFFLTVLTLTSIIVNCYSQDLPLSRIESSFERVSHSTALPCSWKLNRVVANNGLPFFKAFPFFIREDSTKYEIEFFKTQSLPFFDSLQTNFETSKAFFTWEINQLQNNKELSIKSISGNAEDTFVIAMIKSKTSEYYRLIGTANNITYSIKLYTKKRPFNMVLDELKTLYVLNTKY